MKTTALADRYIRSEDFASHIDGVQLAPEVWAVFAQLHQARTTAEMAATLKLDLKAVQSAVRSLTRRKLIQKHVLDWRAYTANIEYWTWDGSHLTEAGSWLTTDYVSRWMAAIEHRPCPRPWNRGGPRPCRGTLA